MARRRTTERIEPQSVITEKARPPIKFSMSVSHDLMQRIITFRKKEGISTDQEVLRIAAARLVG